MNRPKAWCTGENCKSYTGMMPDSINNKWSKMGRSGHALPQLCSAFVISNEYHSFLKGFKTTDMLEVVRHEAAQKMRVGPSGSACRNRPQSTSSCFGQKPWWWALRKRSRQTGSVVNQRDERKRTIRWGVENIKMASKLVAISTPG